MSRFAKSRRGRKKNYEAAAAAEAAISGSTLASSGSSGAVLSDFALKPLVEATRQPRKPGTVKFPAAIREPVVLGVGGAEKYVQRPNLPQSFAPGASALMALIGGRQRGGKLLLDDATRKLVTPMELDDSFYEEVAPRDKNRHRLRRAKQTVTWQTVVVPLLVQALMQQQHGVPAPAPIAVCTCPSPPRTMSVLLCDFERTSSTAFLVCSCRPAAPQLVADGYFPCAPTRPSVAFSLRLLEFISIHSLNVAPNVTAWASSLETFWARRGFTVAEKRAFRTRLGNALQWYMVVVNQKDAAVSRAIHVTRQAMSRKRKVDSDANLATPPRPTKRVRFLLPDTAQDEAADSPLADDADSVSSVRIVAAGDDDTNVAATVNNETVPLPDNAPANEGPGGERGRAASPQPLASEYDARRRPADGRPAEYLRERCPLCFGGPRPTLTLSGSHVIVCLDANFSQKRRRSNYTDPPLQYAISRFLDPRDVEHMEREVEDKRTKVTRKRKKGTSAKLHDDVLDECEKSFIAAQEKVTKASKNYYSDTGLMAILCRHDQVLYVVNMSTPGERQHYALALLREVFSGIPPDWSVGVLYDIACQLSRSIEKHNFLPEFSDRMTFAVSVFHAYGHQWACQLVFHPRKRVGFGLTDGEGCERFWSALRGLIACLRVSGYHRRLFVLDRQIEYVEGQNIFKVGKWLARRWMLATRRLHEAALRLELIGVRDDVLEEQWKAQLETQLARPPRQSKYAGDKAIEAIVLDLARLEELRDELRQTRRDLNTKAHKVSAREVQGLKDKLESGRLETKRLQERVALAKAQLGTGALRAFEELRGDAYTRARVNARALRVNIRMAVRAHKFEREKLERNYRRQVMHNKDHAQTRDLVHSREKNISALVRKFNMIVTQMEVLLKTTSTARRKKQAPRRLDAKKLFRLDVDDDIWQEDPGLGPQDEGDLPRWQVDADVREGIIALLERKRCEEELERVSAEARALVHWWLEERECLRDFCDGTEDVCLRAEGQLRLERLSQLALAWNLELAQTELSIVFPFQHDTSDVAPADESVTRRGSASPSEEAADDPVATGGVLDSAATRTADDVASDSESDTWTDASSADESPDEDDPDAALLDLATTMDADAAFDGDDDDGGYSQALPTALAAIDEDADSEESDFDDLLAVYPSALSPVNTVSLPHAKQEDGSSAQQAINVDNIAETPVNSASTSGAPGTMRTSSVQGELNRACGPYSCLGEDVTRMERRTAWLSGQGLAVFAEAHHAAVANATVGHLPSDVFLDVKAYLHAKEGDDETGMASNKTYIAAKLKHVPTPCDATKWLIVVHIVQPQHWTLLEVRWTSRELRFYDSLAACGTYDERVKVLAFEFLAICEQIYATSFDVSTWSWIGETRPARQTNWYDCGPFVAADLVSLLSSDEPSKLTQDDMRGWRRSMVEFMRSLQVARVKPIVKRNKYIT